MLEIKPQSLSALLSHLGEFLEQIPAEFRGHLATSQEYYNERESMPSLQLSYDELSATEIDRLLGYAGIATSNTPIGLDVDFPPCTIGDDPRDQFLLFPLTGLENHLATEEPGIVEAIRNLGSLDAFIEARADAMTAVEYLVVGTLTCIEFCRWRRQTLAITW